MRPTNDNHKGIRTPWQIAVDAVGVLAMAALIGLLVAILAGVH
jgi:hypothetical protein